MEEKPVNKIVVLLRKEWIELRQQRALVLGILLPPLLLSFMAVGAALGSSYLSADDDIKEVLPTISKINPAFAGMSAHEAGQALISQQLSLLFLLLPTILPSVVASYSVVGEKTSRTLEPLLATPLRTWELLFAKCLVAVIPSLVGTWAAAFLFAVVMRAVALSDRVFVAVVSPGWLIAMIVATPLLSLITVAATVAISSRVNDPRTAQQVSAVLIIPIMLVFFGQITGLLVLNPFIAVAGSFILAVVAAGVLWLAVRVFQREAILTRWS